MFIIKSHNNSQTWSADFYIQSKGENAGKPMWDPSANCFGIITDPEILLPKYFYYLVLAAYNRGAFKPFIKGSVIPYITIEDFCQAISN
ncbi:DUF6943 family protein [Flexithrix dorotheae]|uniref:DUF6943 family protein n=1 Tax=Flexithrix dorotheae TaxID=70993 RepID=UPI000361EBF2|nr:hypothetical protein [Flexithrix dorotheae]